MTHIFKVKNQKVLVRKLIPDNRIFRIKNYGKPAAPTLKKSIIRFETQICTLRKSNQSQFKAFEQRIACFSIDISRDAIYHVRLRICSVSIHSYVNLSHRCTSYAPLIYLISCNSVEPDPNKIAAVRAFQQPSILQQLKGSKLTAMFGDRNAFNHRLVNTTLYQEYVSTDSTPALGNHFQENEL
ncbi:hypothetical protein BpHYR1_002993 [Brachionus plicatilis]|uniref:Uncharacterized protein n=1 Tax=Brachionus plicatilis TaxID=10195 RepID=A0A3M7RFU1_BRAPC|nr:hypothetical protein BpHYR1_002993 [Brachionus plicatilis]